MANKSALTAENVESKNLAFPNVKALEEPEIKSSTDFARGKATRRVAACCGGV